MAMDLGRLRMLLLVQEHGSIPTAFLVVLIFWKRSSTPRMKLIRSLAFVPKLVSAFACMKVRSVTK